MKLRSLFLALVLTGCPGAGGSSEPPAPPPAPAPLPDSDLCGQMCQHLLELGCEEGKPVYNNDLPGPPDVPNQSCEDFCKEMQTKGIPINPKCVATAPACAQIESYREKSPDSCGTP
jgi:hypothetical protein